MEHGKRSNNNINMHNNKNNNNFHQQNLSNKQLKITTT